MDFAKRVTTAEELLAAIAMLLDVGHKAVRGEISAYKPIEFARDTAPFRNIMATVYGLDPVGGTTTRKLKKKTVEKLKELDSAA